MKTNRILAIALVALVFASCSKSDVKPEVNNGFEVELIDGSNILVTTTDTTLNIIAPNGVNHVKGNNLVIYNLGHSEATVIAGKTGRASKYYIEEGGKIGYGTR